MSVSFVEFFNGVAEGQVGVDNAPLTDEFIELAIELIDEFIPEPNAQWVSIDNDTTPDPNEPWRTKKGSSSNHDVRIVFLQDNLNDRELIRYLKTTETATGNVNGIMYQTDFEPTLKDTVRWQGRTMTINAINPIQPIDAAIIYVIEFNS